MPLLALDSLLKETGEKILLESGGGIIVGNAHLGFEVLDFWPNYETRPKETFERSGEVLVNTTGLPTVKPRADQPRQAIDFSFRIDSRSELARFRRFIAALRGRQKAFWIPSWEADFKPTAPVYATDIVVEGVGYTSRQFPFNARRHMALIKWNRTMHLFSVVGTIDNGTTETLQTNTAFGASPGFPVRQVMISLLLLVRLESDEVVYTYISPDHMTAQIQVVELPLEYPAA